MSVFGEVYMLLVHVGTSRLPDDTNWKSPLPSWAYYTIIVMVVIWFARGKTFHYRLPMLTFRGWLALSLYVSSFAIVFEIMPWWLAGPAMWAAIVFAYLLESLDALGRKNFEALKASSAACESA
jgi:hypothetical protein